MPARITDVTRYFASKIDKRGPNDCWLWRGGGAAGYGTFRPDGRTKPRKYAHRFAWEETHGPIPTGLFVCHTCDVRKCCNPAHLFLGTARDNVLDMIAKGRDNHANNVRGTAHRCAKLNPESVRAIRALVAGGMAAWRAGARYGVTQKTVLTLVHRKTWAHVA